MSAEVQLEALIDIIGTSARQAIAEYKKGGNDIPTIRSKEYHPIDFATNGIALKKAVRLLEGACQQLCASLAPPQHTIYSYAMPLEWACVRVVIRAKVADVLAEYPDGLHVDELAKMVRLEKGKLARVLRLLATKGCFTEVKPDTFANNRISLTTLTSCDVSALSLTCAENTPNAAVVLYESMTEPEFATSYDPEKSALMYALKKKGVSGKAFDLLMKDPEKLERFQRAMIGLGDVMGSLSILHYYPWNEVKTVCDVGCNIGTAARPLLKMHPHLTITEQDLPEVLIQAKEVWANDMPNALENAQVEFVPLNFLEQTPVKGQDVYYLRNITHDWPDDKVVIIMKNLRVAMAPHSRLLIHDYVLTFATHDPNATSFGADVAPEPLLANFGNGNNLKYQQDLNMMLLYNGKERSPEDLIALGSAAGLRLEKVYDLSETSVLEFMLNAPQTQAAQHNLQSHKRISSL